MENKQAANHTPGPWIYDGEFVRAKVQPINAHYPGDTVPQIVAHIEDCHEWEDNANLIAAAPDLLEALKQLHDDTIGDVSPYVLNIVRAAIAKAEAR